MTELLWILAWLPLALTAVSGLPAPLNVHVTLDQSGCMLRWEPGAGTPNGTYFSVHTARLISDQRLIPVSGCQRVQSPLTCNLTETFGGLDNTFNIEVKAHLGNNASQPAKLGEYKPMAHLPLPRLNVTSCRAKLCLHFLPPYSRFQKNYKNIEYELRIKSSHTDEPKSLNIRSLESMENVMDLVPGTNYCVSIRLNYSLYKLQSNFSRPECISVPGHFSSDKAVSAVMSLLVMFVIAIFALLFWTGFICLKRSPMPSVLTSISHLEEVKVSSGDAPLSLVNVRSMAPPAGKRTSSSSEESDEESCTETSGMSSSGANYALRQGANPLSSTSSSSSSLSSPSKLEPPPNRTQDSQHEVLVVIEPRPGAEQKLDGLEKRRTEEEEAAVNVGQEVNLLTLTFGWPEKQEEEEETEEEEGCPDVPDELSALAAPLVQPADDAAASCCTDEDYDDWDYMRRWAT